MLLKLLCMFVKWPKTLFTHVNRISSDHHSQHCLTYSMLILYMLITFLNKVLQVNNSFFLQPSKLNLESSAHIKSAFKPHTPPLFGILTACTHTYMLRQWGTDYPIKRPCWPCTIDQSTFARGWQPSGHSWILRLAQRGVKDYWLLDKGTREICRIESPNNWIKQTN